MRYKAAMEFLFHGIENKHHDKKQENLHVDVFGFDVDMPLVTIKVTKSRVLKLMTRALFLSLVIVSLPWLNMIIRDPLPNVKEAKIDAEVDIGLNPLNKELLMTQLFHDLASEGLVKTGDRALFLTTRNTEALQIGAQVLTTFNIDTISYLDFNQQSLIPDETYDFIVADDFKAASNVIDCTLKKNGFVAIQMQGKNPRKTFQKPSGSKIVYLRRFGDSTIVGMKKIVTAVDTAATGRRLLGIPAEAKKAVLRNLEDVLLEPPRAASGKSRRYFKRTRYLPDLIGDSLESYQRRVFINVGLSGNNDASNDPNWFSKHYPTRNTKFEIYNIETVMEEPISRKTTAQVGGMSDWLRKNVQENEYVVMKAEAEVVEELVKSRAIKLVDELFLECRHRGIKKSSLRSRRAYWECLALYGMLRDEGIAVHQWWG